MKRTVIIKNSVVCQSFMKYFDDNDYADDDGGGNDG